MKNQVTLVRNASVLYQLTEEDYLTLSGLGVPIRKIDLTYLPTLKVYANSLSFETVLLSDLEQKMLVNLLKKWPYDAAITDKAVILSFPRKTNEDLVEKCIGALRRWYREHFISLEQVTKRGGKNTRIVLTKKLSD
jgi:hypothetical protein